MSSTTPPTTDSPPRSSLAPQPGQRVPKLRLSCDACAAAKVKCDKSHPRCGKCATGELTCVYGPSRKYGKPGHKRPKSGDSSNGRGFIRSLHSSLHQNHCPELQIQFEELMQHVDDGSLTPSWPATTHPESSWNPSSGNIVSGTPLTSSTFSFVDDCFGSTDCSSSGRIGSLDTDSSSSTHGFGALGESPGGLSICPAAMDFQDLMDSDTIHPIDTSFSSTVSLSEAQTPSNGPFPQPSVLHDNSGTHCCYGLAYTTLASLHFGSSASPSSFSHFIRPPAPPVPTLDHVLRNNKTAISNVLQLLACSCARDPHLAMLYASITSKILIWYQVAAGIKTSAFSSKAAAAPVPSAANGSTASPSEMGSTVALMPITIGAFSLDEEDQESLRRQLLLSALRKAGQLIDTFMTRHSEAGDDLDGAVGDLYATLGGWLKSELLRTIREMKQGARVGVNQGS
ncbi:hypothetical protein MMC16_005989 [Acarospora aff. strigata]|nr:hypothetical protein [Acarospora aff. strigata]